jgi:hypothetical protein
MMGDVPLIAILFVGLAWVILHGAVGLVDILFYWRWRVYVLSPFALAQCCVPGCPREPRFTIPGDPITYVCGPHL